MLQPPQTKCHYTIQLMPFLLLLSLLLLLLLLLLFYYSHGPHWQLRSQHVCSSSPRLHLLPVPEQLHHVTGAHRPAVPPKTRRRGHLFSRLLPQGFGLLPR